MLNFNTFFSEIEVELKKESIMHVSLLTGISESTLHKSFSAGITIPSLNTFSKLLNFFDWEVSIQKPKSQYEIIGSDLEDILRKAFVYAGPLSPSKYPSLNVPSIRRFILKDKTLSVITVFHILSVLGFKLSFCKPVINTLLVEAEYDFSD